jgi:glycosyltransferase involved in cell wall biosynthesis
MNFALIITNLAGGGAEKSLLKLSTALLDRGHSVHLILLEDTIEYNLPTGIVVHALQTDLTKGRNGVVGKRLLAAKLKKLHAKLSAGRAFDVTISTLPFTDEVVDLAGIPNVWHRIADALSGEIDELRERGKILKAYRRLRRYRRIYHGKRLIAVSKGLADDLRERLGVTAGSIEVIYNIYPCETIRALGSASNLHIPRAPYIIHVGRFSPQKRHDLLFAAFKSLKTAHQLVLLTQQSAQLDALVEEHHLRDRVVIPGFQENPYNWIKGADLLVLSSDHEGLPNVLVEALILKTRVVSTDCPSGPREILGDLAEKYLVECNNAAALAGAMRRALREPFAEPAGFAARFCAAATIKKYEQLAAAR